MHRRRSRSPAATPTTRAVIAERCAARGRRGLRSRSTPSRATTTTRWNCRPPWPAGTATGSRCGTRCRASSRRRRPTPRRIGVPPDNVRVISPFVGGAFGSAGPDLAAPTARRLRRPAGAPAGQAGADPEADVRRRSAIGPPVGSGWPSAPTGPDGSRPSIHEGRTETARYATYEDGLTAAPKFMYTSPNMRSTYRVVPLDVNLPTYMRGPGATTGTFALESAMDDLAYRLGMDPIELRLRNEPERDQTDGPAVLHAAAHRVPAPGRRDVRVGAAQSDAARRPRRRPADRHRAWPRRGYHTSRRPSDVYGAVERRRHRRRADRDQRHGTGHVHVDDAGGRRRARAAVERVRFALGDSQYPHAPSHSGSRTMASVGSAVFTAANMLRDRLIRTAVIGPEARR